MPSNSLAKKSAAMSQIIGNCGDWILGLIILIIIMVAIFIYTPKYQASVDKFINLDIEYQNIGGIYNNLESKLTKWNADNFQQLKLTFKDVNVSKTPINKVNLDFKDANTNNLYTYSVENKIPSNLSFSFKLNLPPGRAYILIVYINDSTQPTFIKDIYTEESYFNFTDITNQNIPAGVDSKLSMYITNPDKPTQSLSEDSELTRKRNLGTLKMQPYNIVNIPVTIPKLSEYKNLFRITTSIDPALKAEYETKLAALDNFVFKEIVSVVTVIGLPNKSPITTIQGATTTTMNSSIADEYENYGVSADELTKFEREYPNRVKVIAPGVNDCVQGDSNKCGLIVKNLVDGAKYKVVIRAAYQQLGSVEPNIRYTKPQTIIFSVSSSSNEDADLNKTFKIADKAKQYVMNQEQKEFIASDQNRQDYNLLNLESDIKVLSNKIYYRSD